MTATVRIALAYFSVVPLQRWASAIGAALMLVALTIRVTTNPAASREVTMTLLMLGGVLVLMAPLMMGGGMMRAASTRIVLHQRPWGRQRMLLGATLAVVLLTVGVTLLFTLVQRVAPPRFSRTPVFEVLALSWSAVSLIWLVVFIATGNRLLSALIGLVPLALVRFGRTVFDGTPDALLMVAVTTASWAAFSLWYLRAPSIRRLIYSLKRQEEVYDNPIGRFFQWVTGAERSASRARAMDQHLGMSPQGHALMGIVWVLAGALMQLIFSIVFSSPSFPAGKTEFMKFLAPFFLVPVVIITWWALGFWLTRRMRALWVRAGMNRMELFRHCERSGFRAGLMSLGLVLIAMVLYSLAKWPAHREIIFVCLVVQIAFLICVFYAGLSLTRGWSAPDVLLCIGLCAVLAGEIILLGPWNSERNAVTPYVLVGSVLLAPLLRWHAARRWRVLDWRVAQMPRTMRWQAA